MREDWEVKTLGEVCDILDNKRKPITKKDRVEGEIPYYGATGVLSYVKDFLFDEKLVLLGEDGAKWESGDNSAFIISGKTWVNNHVHVLRPVREIIMDNWLVYNLNFQNLMPFVTGMTVPKLNQGNMKKIQIPIPPLEEQKQIVALLDKAFTAIDQAKANIEKNIANAKELFQSKLNAIFSQKGDGWEEKTFKEVCVLQRGFDLPKRLRQKGNYPLVTSSGVKDTHVEFKVNGPGVVTGRSGSIGNVFYIENKFWPLNTALYIKDFKGNIEKYVYYFLKNFDLSKYSTGTGVPTLNRNFVHDENVLSTNNIDKQKELVKTLDSLTNKSEQIENLYNNKLYGLEDLKKSILQKAFAGALTSPKGTQYDRMDVVLPNRQTL